MYSPFLWRISKGQSELIIKRRWRRRPSSTRQISTQNLKLREHIQQNLSICCLNGYDSIQHTLNGWITRRRRWRINNGSRINKLLSSGVTWRRRLRCNTCGRLYSRVFRANFHLSCSLPKEGVTYGSDDMNWLRCRMLGSKDLDFYVFRTLICIVSKSWSKQCI